MTWQWVLCHIEGNCILGWMSYCWMSHHRVELVLCVFEHSNTDKLDKSKNVNILLTRDLGQHIPGMVNKEFKGGQQGLEDETLFRMQFRIHKIEHKKYGSKH